MAEKVFFHTAHKALWNWLSKRTNHKTRKRQWPGWDFNGGNVKKTDYDCLACEYVDKVTPLDPCCGKCPIIWPDNSLCGDDGNIFDDWFFSHSTEKRAKLAAQIRDLPVREGVVCK